MGKHGPCHHCGVTSTPLWRNGPPEKPILCNACGSRWRTKGTLTNYTPMHSRDSYEIEEPKHPQERKISFKFKDKLPTIKWNECNIDKEPEDGDYSPCFRKVDEEMSNRSSSGSAVSYAESCAHFSTSDICDISGSIQSNAWESVVPSRKRTEFSRKPSGEKLAKDLHLYKKPSSVERLTKDLHSILHQETSCFVSTEEDLLYENSTPMGSSEIGHGGMLIKQPKLGNTEEESEASSLPDDKTVSVCTALPVPVHTQGMTLANISNSKLKKTQETVEQPRRVKLCLERFNILHDRNSVLGSVDMKDIANFDGFAKFLTREEQQQLIKLLPTVDVSISSESLKCVFTSPQFVEAFSFFQQLLREGIFDLTSTQMKVEDCKNLKRLALSNMVKSRLVERYYGLQKGTKCDHLSVENRVAFGMDGNYCSASAPLKRPRESATCNTSSSPEAKIIVKSPRRLTVTWSQDQQLPMRNLQQDLDMASGSPTNEATGYTSQTNSCCSPRSPFASPFLRVSMFDPLEFSNSTPDQELLLDVRSNSSFPEAELLSDSWAARATTKSFCTPCAVSEKEGSLSSHSTVTFGSNQPNTDGC